MFTSFARRLQYCLVLALVVPFAFDAAPAAADPRERRQASAPEAAANPQGDASDDRVAGRTATRSDDRDDTPTRTDRDDRPNRDAEGDPAVTDETAQDERVGAADRKKKRPGKRNKPNRPNRPAAAPAPAPGAASAPAPEAAPAPAPETGPVPARGSAPALAPPPTPTPAPSPNPGAGPDDRLCQDEDLDDPDPPSADDDDASLDLCRADQVIVQLNPGASIDQVNARNGTTTLSSIPSRDLYLLQLPNAPSGGITHEAVYRKQLEDDPDTERAYFNYTNQAPEGRPRRFYSSGTPVDQGATPASGPAAPPAQLGVAAAGECATGTTVTVAVVDTGIQRDHPAFAGMAIVNEANVLSDGGTVNDVGDGQDNDRDGLTDEMTGHGTHVAGIVAQVAPDVSLMPIKALDSDGVGDTFLLAKAIYHAIDNGAKVINLSLGTTADPADIVVLGRAIEEADKSGIVLVAAAGNEDRLDPQEYPGTGGFAIGVASRNNQDLKSTFSNYHGDLAISAPGDDIVSAFPGNRYVAWSGTSMATPWVSGAAALLIEDNASSDTGTIENRLRSTAARVTTDPANAEYGGKMGDGRLDVAAAACGTP